MYTTSQSRKTSLVVADNDPFASAIHEQQKQHYEQLQKSQSEKLAQTLYKGSPIIQLGAPVIGFTLSMFFQQMTHMVQNLS